VRAHARSGVTAAHGARRSRCGLVAAASAAEEATSESRLNQVSVTRSRSSAFAKPLAAAGSGGRPGLVHASPRSSASRSVRSISSAVSLRSVGLPSASSQVTAPGESGVPSVRPPLAARGPASRFPTQPAARHATTSAASTLGFDGCTIRRALTRAPPSARRHRSALARRSPHRTRSRSPPARAGSSRRTR
jgi:hypothetical protein